MSNNQYQQLAQQYAQSILKKELNISEVLEKIKDSTYVDNNQKIEEKDIISILELIKEFIRSSLGLRSIEDTNSLIAQIQSMINQNNYGNR